MGEKAGLGVGRESSSNGFVAAPHLHHPTSNYSSLAWYPPSLRSAWAEIPKMRGFVRNVSDEKATTSSSARESLWTRACRVRFIHPHLSPTPAFGSMHTHALSRFSLVIYYSNLLTLFIEISLTKLLIPFSYFFSTYKIHSMKNSQD